jgi:hypothetical protein
MSALFFIGIGTSQKDIGRKGNIAFVIDLFYSNPTPFPSDESIEMKVSRRQVSIAGLSVLAGSSISTMGRAEIGEGLLNISEGLEDFALTQDAYIYGYPSSRWR